jgi:hypothetical protein
MWLLAIKQHWKLALAVVLVVIMGLTVAKYKVQIDVLQHQNTTLTVKLKDTSDKLQMAFDDISLQNKAIELNNKQLIAKQKQIDDIKPPVVVNDTIIKADVTCSVAIKSMRDAASSGKLQ